jgi:hypothetical protein
LDIATINALKINHDSTKILCRVFIGRWNDHQTESLDRVFGELITKYKHLGYDILFEKYTNDMIFKSNWNPADTSNALISADIHFLPTLLHENCLARGQSDLWTIENVKSSIQRLRNHLGFPNSQYVDCPLLTYDIAKLFTYLYPLGLCVPFIIVSIEFSEIGGSDSNSIQRYELSMYILSSSLYRRPF